MVLVDLHPKEIDAFDKLLDEAKLPVAIGYILGVMRLKIARAIQDEQIKRNKAEVKRLLEEEKKRKM